MSGMSTLKLEGVFSSERTPTRRGSAGWRWPRMSDGGVLRDDRRMRSRRSQPASISIVGRRFSLFRLQGRRPTPHWRPGRSGPGQVWLTNPPTVAAVQLQASWSRCTSCARCIR